MKTICATITSPLRSSVTIIRISGSQTLKCLEKFGVKNQLTPQKSFFHKIIFDDGAELIDEAIITFFKAPRSFTGEDVAEISVHSSQYVLKKIFEKLLSIENVDLAGAGEFSKRAFLNGKIDLVQAEAIPDLIASETEAQHKQAILQLQGNLGKIYENWRHKIMEISAFVEALIDFPEDDLPTDIVDKINQEVIDLKTNISQHLNDNKVGQKIKNGLSLAIIGAPNSGKSSLMNFLAQSEVAIVSEIAGTTRDIIDTHLEIAGVPVIISDTAGIRLSTDLIEQEGIKRALKKAQDADIKIYLVDALNPIIQKDLIDKNTILVFNKIDKILNNAIDFDKIIANFGIDKEIIFLTISITENINFSQLFDVLKEKIDLLIPSFNSPLITQERYRSSLQNCLNSLESFNLNKNIEICAENLRICINEIGKINGKIDIENILDLIFSKFCIGK
jgi:tRNA modification GTPase